MHGWKPCRGKTVLKGVKENKEGGDCRGKESLVSGMLSVCLEAAAVESHYGATPELTTDLI